MAPLAHERLGTPGDHCTSQPHPKSQPARQGTREMVVNRFSSVWNLLTKDIPCYVLAALESRL